MVGLGLGIIIHTSLATSINTYMTSPRTYRGIPHYYSPPSPSQGVSLGRWGCIDQGGGYTSRTGSGVDLSLDEEERGEEGVCRCGCCSSVEGATCVVWYREEEEVR